MSTSTILGVVGGAVGFWIGGPAGAQLGFALGSAAGSIIDPEVIKGPSLNDAPVQTSRDGVPITLFWGLQYAHGNLIQKNAEQRYTTSESQGKGGGPEVETEHRTRTYAIGVGRTTIGPIAEITRIWENNKLVYDVRTTPAIPAEETAKYAEGIRIYLGTEDQLPDPDLEAEWGTDETPAYRGLAYVVWVNKDLTDVGGAIPTYAFEVNGSRDATITSEPYPADAIEGLAPTVSFPTGWLIQWPVDEMETASTPESGDFGATIEEYLYDEAFEVNSLPQAGYFGNSLEEHEYSEALEVASIPEEGDFGNALVDHEYSEAIETTTTPESGTLV